MIRIVAVACAVALILGTVGALLASAPGAAEADATEAKRRTIGASMMHVID